MATYTVETATVLFALFVADSDFAFLFLAWVVSGVSASLMTGYLLWFASLQKDYEPSVQDKYVNPFTDFGFNNSSVKSLKGSR